MRTPHVRALVCVAALLAVPFSIGDVPAHAVVQEGPTPAEWEAELKKVTAQRGRVVVVVSTENVVWAFRAANIASISGNVVRLAKGAATNVTPNAGPRAGMLNALRQFTEMPSTAADGAWGLLTVAETPITGASQVMKEDTNVEVRAIITWWCEPGARNCANPPQ